LQSVLILFISVILCCLAIVGFFGLVLGSAMLSLTSFRLTCTLFLAFLGFCRHGWNWGRRLSLQIPKLYLFITKIS